jgi:hypothetical protein
VTAHTLYAILQFYARTYHVLRKRRSRRILVGIEVADWVFSEMIDDIIREEYEYLKLALAVLRVSKKAGALSKKAGALRQQPDFRMRPVLAAAPFVLFRYQIFRAFAPHFSSTRPRSGYNGTDSKGLPCDDYFRPVTVSASFRSPQPRPGRRFQLRAWPFFALSPSARSQASAAPIDA